MASIAAHAPKLASQPLLPWSNPADGDRRPLSEQACQQWVTSVLASHGRRVAARPAVRKVSKVERRTSYSTGCGGLLSYGRRHEEPFVGCLKS